MRFVLLHPTRTLVAVGLKFLALYVLYSSSAKKFNLYGKHERLTTFSLNVAAEAWGFQILYHIV